MTDAASIYNWQIENKLQESEAVDTLQGVDTLH
jgi:hypothetical protein